MPQMRLVMKLAARGSFFCMKTLFSRQMAGVEWRAVTCFLSKSILVKMPRLPTMRVMGSHDISTMLPPLAGLVCLGWVAMVASAINFSFLSVESVSVAMAVAALMKAADAVIFGLVA